MSAVAEKQKQVAVDHELEDTSQVLHHDEEQLREVNDNLWWGIDAVCAFFATFLTHGSDEMSIPVRLVCAAAMLAVGFGLCKIYFTAGLTRPMSGQHPIDKWWHMAITHIGNIFFFWEWVVSAYRFFAGYTEPEQSMGKMVVALALGFYFSLLVCDMVAGFVHWFGDTSEMYFFDYHHRDSRYMTRQSYVHHCWDSIALALALSPVLPFLRTNLFFTTVRLVAVQANECHMWSHCTSKEIPPFVKVLQDLTIVLSWKAHKEHHKPPHLIDYCVFNGWANPIFNIVLPGPVTQFVERNIRDNPKWKELKKILDT